MRDFKITREELREWWRATRHDINFFAYLLTPNWIHRRKAR